MTYKLYSSTGSGGFIVEVSLVKASAEHELIEIDFSKGDQNKPEFVAINPMRQVPALIAPDGAVLTESAAIVVHLANLFPGKGLAPTPATSEHAAFLRWMFFMSVNLYEGVRHCYYPDRFTCDPKGEAAVKQAAESRLSQNFAIVEEALKDGPFLCGTELSMADVYLGMVMKWAPVPTDTPRLQAIREAVGADPLIGPVWRAHGFDSQ